MTRPSRSHHLPRRAVVAVAGLGLSIPLLVTAAATPASAARVPAPGATAGPAATGALEHLGKAPLVPASARALGAVTATASVSGGIFLAPRDPSALAAAAAAVSDPHSPEYGHYLAAGQFAAAYGPSPATVQAVEGLLRADGLKVTGVASNNLYVQFSGSATRVEAAFHTGLERWRLADGEVGTDTTSAPSLPASIAHSVTAIVGLDDLVRPHTMLVRPTPAERRRATALRTGQRRTVAGPAADANTAAVSGGPQACGAADADASQLDGVTDSQLAASYGVDGLYSAGDLGAGQTVDIYELEPFAMSDIASFDKCYFDGVSHTNQVKVIPIEGGQPAGPGSGEALLDIEDVSAIAPDAHINVYEAPLTTSGTLDDYVAIVDQDLAHVVSTSWGLCETGAQLGDPGLQQAENELFEQAALQGQSVFGPAGDDGSDDCSTGTSPVAPVLSVDDPASQPFVVGVGGTSIYGTPPKSAPTEAVWNDGPFGGGTGGGISNTWPMPAWQQDSGVPGVLNSYSTSSGDSYEACRAPTPSGAGFGASTLCRQVPDVTALADEGTGITVYAAEYGGWTTFGGTSSSTPLWAAMIADINASRTCATTPGTAHDLGFVSPALYQVASNPTAYSEAFNDITKGNNDTLGASHGTFPATSGYDMASGLGSPRITDPATGGAGLASLLCGVATGPRPAVTGVSPSFGTIAGGTTVTLTGSGFEAGGRSDIEAVMFGPQAGTDLTVDSPTQLTVTTPAAYDPPTGGLPAVLAQAVHIAVLATDGAVNAPDLDDVYSYVNLQSSSAVPAVSYIGPSGGPQAGGTSVTILGAGFGTGSTPVVDFGGIASPKVTVLNDHTLVASTPAEGGGTSCAKFDAGQPICQVEVTVTVGSLTSAVAPILPALEGAASFNSQGVIDPTPGTETVTAPTEFDYAPAPTITSISPSPGNENGGVISIHGTGFNLLTFQWMNQGPASQAIDQDNQIQSITPTEIDIASFAQNSTTTEPVDLPGGIGVQTLGGLSNTETYQLAGVPVLTAISRHYGLTTGGQGLVITGKGLVDVNRVRLVSRFEPAFNPPAIQLVIDHVSDTEISIATPADFPVPTDVELCSITGCSTAQPTIDLFTYAYPGRAVVTGSSPASGPATGGTLVKITGSDLSAVYSVWFGSVKATRFYNPPGEFPGGASNIVFAYAPPGKAGKVSVTVQTLGGIESGDPPSASSPNAVFTYG